MTAIDEVDFEDGFSVKTKRCKGVTRGGGQCSVMIGDADDYCGLHKDSCGPDDDPNAVLARRLHGQHRRGASARGIDFNLSKEDVYNMLSMAGGRCQVTGVPFEMERKKGQRRRPYYPSIDRVDASKGYTRRNTRVVISAANLAMNEWGEDVLYRMAECMLSTGRIRPPGS